MYDWLNEYDHDRVDEPFVSVSVITYQHSDFIGQCLDSILMQETVFSVEILIHDDASTDGTVEIIRYYELKYPNIIKPIYEKENQWVKGRRGSAIFNFPRAKGKYIALCEGDDYWMDPLKLQKQVEFMEGNDEISLVHGVAEIINLGQKKNAKIFPQKIPVIEKNATRSLLCFNYHVRTATALFKKKDIINLDKVGNDDFLRKFGNGDILLWYTLSKKGAFYHSKETLAAYRVLMESASNTASVLKKRKMIIKSILTRINLSLRERYFGLLFILIAKLLKEYVALLVKKDK